jgi:hypothetical protein
MIKIRLDVDYPYSSRQRSFLTVALNIKKPGKGYLQNSKVIAKMVNESREEVRAYWFFTPYTTPDRELLELLNSDPHEVCLHVATQPYPELEHLEKATGRKVKYYTVHGTARLIARIIWRRKLSQAKAPIPAGFPLKSFYDYPTIHLDRVCYDNSPGEALEIARQSVAKGEVLHVHPEWLFQRGTFNHRGPYYDSLRALLEVEADFEALAVRKKSFLKMAGFSEHYEYLSDHVPTDEFLKRLAERGVDLYTFIERSWCCPVANPPKNWLKTQDNIALIKIVPYADWLAAVGKKTRNMIRKAEKSGVKTEVADPSDRLAEGIWKIYNETPIRQGRAFTHFGWPLDKTKLMVSSTASQSTFIGSYLNGELVGFIQLVHGEQITVMSQILSMQKHWDKAVNNALVAKAIEVCAAKNETWLMYGRMGNHPSLDAFKESNEFSKCTLTRFYVPLTRRGRIAAKLGLHREIKDVLPQPIKNTLIPALNWASRTKLKVKKRRR